MTYRELLTGACQQGMEAHEALTLLEHLFSLSRTSLLIHMDEDCDEQKISSFEQMAARRLAGYPLQYLLGEWEFFGLPFYVGEGVLIPRADTEVLVETALECAKTAATFGIDPKIAFLSYSTKGSGKGDAVDKVKNACDKAKAAAPELAIDGEMQFDAAVSPVVGQQKFPGSKVAGHANTFIFPEIQSGNIGYKIAQRLGGFAAYGPILQGLNAPINDLSRGCDADEVYKMAIITAALA